MGYQGRRKIRRFVDEYGPVVGGYKYKRYKPEPLAVTILKLLGEKADGFPTTQFLLEAITDYLKPRATGVKHVGIPSKQQIRLRLQYLKRKKFIAFPGKGRFVITAHGKTRLDKIKLDKLRIAKSSIWDGKWRLLTFDIYEEKAHLRDYFRKRLKELGFYHFQRSVFIIPYPCQEEIDLMCSELGIENNVHLITAVRFDGDKELVKHFGLK